MALAKTLLKTDGDTSVPEAVQKKLGIRPGAMLEWVEVGDQIVIKRSGKYTFEDIRKAVFGDKPIPHKTDAELKDGIREYIRKKHARG